MKIKAVVFYYILLIVIAFFIAVSVIMLIKGLITELNARY